MCTSAGSADAQVRILGPQSTVSGGGSAYAGILMDQWTDDVSETTPPISISYTPTNSGLGRSDFANGTYSYAVSDLPYQGAAVADNPPSFAYEDIPIIAEGIGFMYNLPGVTDLHLTVDTACGIFTGEITNWDDPSLQALNPGVTLPNMAIMPVLRGDLAGTTWTLEDWCITDAPAVWQSFVTYVDDNNLNVSPSVSDAAPSSAIPVIENEVSATGDSGPAADVESQTGTITYTEPEYANAYGNLPVAYVENASGDFVQPTPQNVTGALAYASDAGNGVQDLDFNGTGCNVYNPSGYDYLLARTDGAYGDAYGQSLGGFLNYSLTFGQEEAPAIDDPALGDGLEQSALAQTQLIPGAPALSSEEATEAATGVTPAEVQATPCGEPFPVNSTTTTTVGPTGGQVPEAPDDFLLPLVAAGAAGGALLLYRSRHRATA